MGNCCGGEKKKTNLTSGGQRTPAFQGEGHRLGSAGETTPYQPTPASMQRDELPQPLVDENLTEEERAKIRADRAKAAEERLKKQAAGKPKKKPTNNAPLVGPNSQPTMRWTAG